MIGTVIVGNVAVIIGMIALTSPSLKPYKHLFTSLLSSAAVFLSGFTVGHMLTFFCINPPGDKQ